MRVRPLNEVVLTLPGVFSFLGTSITVGDLAKIRRAEDLWADESQLIDFLFSSIPGARRLAVTLIFCLTHEPAGGPTVLELFDKVAEIVQPEDRPKFGYPDATDQNLTVFPDLGDAVRLTLAVIPRGAPTTPPGNCGRRLRRPATSKRR